MTYKKIIYIILTLSILFFGGILSICYSQWGEICRSEINEIIALSLIIFSVPFFVISLIFLFLREEIFRSWARFAKIYLPIAAILIIISAFSNQGGGWGVNTNFDTELITWWLAGIFFVMSIGIIARQYWKHRKNTILRDLVS